MAERLTLYVQGQSARSTEALRVVRALCGRDDARDRFELRVVDINESPEAARRDRVMVVPTLIAGDQRLIGELDEASVLAVLHRE